MVASGHVHYFSSTFVSPCTSQLALRDIEWVRYVFPVLPVIEPDFVSISLGCIESTCALLQTC
jgi:hypothetical protein